MLHGERRFGDADVGNTRREIADRVLERMRERGFNAEQDNAFMNLINDWTLGLIEMAECRSRYAGIMRQRRRTSRNTMELAVLRTDRDGARSENDPRRSTDAEPSFPYAAEIT
jgi:hypothetical protein